MLRVTVELINGRNGDRSTLGVMDVWNVPRKESSMVRGFYEGCVYKKGTANPDLPFRNGVKGRAGRVDNYPRKSYVVWRLVLKMLRDMYPEEK